MTAWNEGSVVKDFAADCYKDLFVYSLPAKTSPFRTSRLSARLPEPLFLILNAKPNRSTEQIHLAQTFKWALKFGRFRFEV